MEVRSDVLVAITHAVAAAKRRREGLDALAGAHSNASRRALAMLTRQAVAAASGRST